MANPNAILYVLCETDFARGYALMHYSRIPYARPLMVGQDGIDELLALQDQWESKDYVGIITWRAKERMVIPDFAQVIDNGQQGAVDVIGLYPSPTPCDLPSNWAVLCERLGYTADQYLSTEIPSFAHNYWMAKPEWFARYLEHAREALDIIEDDASLASIKDVAMEHLPCLFFWANDANVSFSRKM